MIFLLRVSNVPHEKLSGEIVVQQPGYAYIYLSNDNDQPLEVFFDDFTVTHSHSAIVQADDYYPFGLSFNSYRRENFKKNRFLYNEGSELQDDLGLDVFQTQFRMLDPAIGRWWQIDPKADLEELVSWTPYNYSYNNPIKWNDPLGDCPSCWTSLVMTYYSKKTEYSSIISKANAPTQRLISGNSGNTPSDIGMSNQSRTIAKVGGVASDVNAVKETVFDLGKQVAMDTGEIMDKGGEAVSDVGYAFAIPTVGASLPLAGAGEIISAGGKGIKASVHYSNGDYEQGNLEAGKLAFGAVTNKLTGTAIKKSVEVGNITNASENAAQNTILNGLNSMINKIVGYFSDEEK